MEKAFTEIYDKKRWGGGSGSGSKVSPDNLKYIGILEDIIKTNDIKTVCDIGCGDWEFSKYINYNEMGVNYTGIDCVKSVIDSNIQKYKKDGIDFKHKSIDENYIPEGYDLIVIKDVIQHWEDKDILSFMKKIIDKNEYVFSTNGYKFMRDPSKNKIEKRDIKNQYRYFPVDIDKYPMNVFKSKCIMECKHRAKQMVLLKNK
tara:strand:- start:5868 stop:6473 length:606 start_codon:yes stop_codon:yes gene_type:complete